MSSKESESNLSAQVIWQRHRENGEPLILAIHAEGLRSFHRATVLRWVLTGKIPAIKIGRRFWTTQSLVDEWIPGGKAGNPSREVAPPQGKPGPKRGKGSAQAHTKAVESLRKKGLMN